ncbi:MAG: hypothetical protein ACQETL_03715 [Bacteroidota bacterium]
MSNLLENIKEYFNSNSREQILRDWNSTKSADEVGPTVAEYLDELKNIKGTILEPDEGYNFTTSESLNPEFNSGFFFNLA